jgi:hypothetical protein
MTAFELTTLFASHLELLITILMAFISVTSAFLVALYFMDSKLGTILKILIAGLYILSSLFLIGVFQRTSDLLIQIRTNLTAKVIWHTASTESEWILPAFLGAGLILQILLFLGAMGYFVSKQKL